MGDTNQVFVFKLNDGEYAFDVKIVREAIKEDEKDIKPVPNVPEFIKGITNVRGKAIPVIDLEKKLELEERASKYMIIVEIEESTAAILVDDVEEVKSIEKKKMKQAPDIIEDKIHKDFIDSVAVLEDRMIIKLSLENGLQKSEATTVGEMEKDLSKDKQQEESEVTQEEVEERAKKMMSESQKNEDKFECDDCEESFGSKRDLASHKASKH